MSRAVFVLVCSVSLMGCIITREPSYSEPPNTPPVILEHPDSPFGAVVDIDLTEMGTGADASVGAPLRFVATVLDPDVEQDLEGVVFLDYRPSAMENETIGREFPIPSNADTTRRVEFDVNRANLRRGCHTLELHVSTEFENFTNPTPVETEPMLDRGRSIWWLHILDNEDDSVGMDTCFSGSE